MTFQLPEEIPFSSAPQIEYITKWKAENYLKFYFIWIINFQNKGTNREKIFSYRNQFG